MSWQFVIVVLVMAVLLSLLAYYLLVITEGVFLGRRVVVWLYDITAHKYDGIKDYEADYEEFFLVRPLLARLQNIPAPLILDVATGTGRVPYFVLAQPAFNGRVIGIDASWKMLQQAQKKMRPFGFRSALLQQTAAHLSFGANQFDAVTCLESLEFFPSDSTAIREMVRVLKPGGTLLVTRRRGRAGKAFLGRYRTVTQFETLLSELGLDDIFTLPWQQDYDQVYGRKISLADVNNA